MSNGDLVEADVNLTKILDQESGISNTVDGTSTITVTIIDEDTGV